MAPRRLHSTRERNGICRQQGFWRPGCGALGTGSLISCAQVGCDFVVREIVTGALGQVLARLTSTWPARASKGRMEQSEADGLRVSSQPRRGVIRISPTAISVIGGYQPRTWTASLEMWGEVDELCSRVTNAYLATNTSSLSVAHPADCHQAPRADDRAAFLQPPQVWPPLLRVRGAGSQRRGINPRLRGRGEAREDHQPRRATTAASRQPASWFRSFARTDSGYDQGPSARSRHRHRNMPGRSTRHGADWRSPNSSLNTRRDRRGEVDAPYSEDSLRRRPSRSEDGRCRGLGRKSGKGF